jgi:dihydroaeruginoic acid synthetase
MTLNSLEALITDLWTRELGLASVSRNENFFDLGGNSIVAIRIIAELNDEFGINLAMSSLFSAPALADFTGLVNSFLDDTKFDDPFTSLDP